MEAPTILNKSVNMYHVDDFRDFSTLNINDLNNKLFCTFTTLEELDSLIKNLTTTYDIMYNKIFVLPLYNLGKFLWTKIDQGIIDKYLPNGSASIVSTISKAFKRIQTGYIFDYTFIN